MIDSLRDKDFKENKVMSTQLEHRYTRILKLILILLKVLILLNTIHNMMYRVDVKEDGT